MLEVGHHQETTEAAREASGGEGAHGEEERAALDSCLVDAESGWTGEEEERHTSPGEKGNLRDGTVEEAESTSEVRSKSGLVSWC